MRYLVPAVIFVVLLATVQPVRAADLRRDIQVMRQSIATLQNQLRRQDRLISRFKTLDSRLAALEQVGSRGRTSSSSTLESRVRKLEVAVSKLSNRVTILQQTAGGTGGRSSGSQIEARLQKIENVVRIVGGNVTLRASGKVALSGSTAQIDGSQVKINTGTATFSGIVKSNTLITESVESKAYTPGAGNVW